MTRKVGASIVTLVGVALIAITLTSTLFTVGPAFEDMTDGFRPVMQTERLNALAQDVQGLETAAAEFETKILPMVAQQSKTTTEQAKNNLAVAFPAVMKGINDTPTIATQFKGVVGLLSAEQERFAKADAIPTGSMPATTVPWAVFGAGIVLIVLGVLMFRSGKSAAAVALVVGLALAIVPFAMSLPDKASAADTMNDHLKPVYNAELIGGAETSFATMTAMANEMGTKMLPAFPAQMGVTVAQFQQQFATTAPGLAAAIQRMPAALQRFDATIATFEIQLDNYETIKPVSLSPIVWTVVAGGILTALIAGTVFFQRRAASVEALPIRGRKAA